MDIVAIVVAEAERHAKTKAELLAELMARQLAQGRPAATDRLPRALKSRCLSSPDARRCVVLMSDRGEMKG